MADHVGFIRRQLQDLGATKLSWVLEHRTSGAKPQWEATLQASNEMGAPIEIPERMDTFLREALHDGELGPVKEGVWVMDIITGHVTAPQPRSGEGPGADGMDAN